ncbi:MAG: 1,4-dihydroxy-2-naphthoate polyprenyltransferase [Candidatus Zixiibacteriota bacterium]|nr:MAG: 1,4-dihydroxy-2-naphthoate polyprenyltransferase [candidate division Zixibacteria bacterium]
MNTTKFQALVLAARPKTLPAATAPVIIGTVMAVESAGFHLASAVAALIGALLIQIGTNYANDYFDYQKGVDDESRLGPTRVTQAGLISPAAMKMATMAIFALAILDGLYLVWRGGWPILIIGIASILFGILYTAGKYPIGYLGLGDIFVLVFFGPVAVGGTYYVQTLAINWMVLVAGIAPGLFSVAILTVNNLRDVDSDRASGKKTLAVRFGITFARLEYLLSIIVACLMPLVLVLSVGSRPYIAVAIVVVIVAIPSFKVVFSSGGIALNEVLAATGKLLLLYSLLFSVGWLL